VKRRVVVKMPRSAGTIQRLNECLNLWSARRVARSVPLDLHVDAI
jgi:hypothetical protein